MRKKTIMQKIVQNTKACAPNSTASLLTYIATILAVAYVCCVVVTIYYAAVQTELVATIQETESGITKLERTYYDGVSVLSSTNPFGQGYVRPTEVRYEQAKTSSGLTFAGR